MIFKLFQSRAPILILNTFLIAGIPLLSGCHKEIPTEVGIEAKNARLAQVSNTTGFEELPKIQSFDSEDLQLATKIGFEIKSPVLNDGWMNHYEIQTDFGIWHAGSRDMLKIRARELETARKLFQTSQGEVFVDASAEAGKNILLAPIRGLEAAYNTVTQPEETWKKVAGIPEGASRIWTSLAREVEDALSAKDNDSDLEESDSSEKTIKVAEKAAKFGLNKYGFNLGQQERDFYKKLGADPYTDNYIIKARVSRLATIKGSVDLSSRFVPGVGGLGLIGDMNRFVRYAEKISLYDDPWEKAQHNIRILTDMGIAESAISRFYSNQFLTPTYQSIIVESLKELDGVQDRHEFLELVNLCVCREDAVFFAQVANELAYIHKNQNKLVQIVSSGNLPAALNSSGQMLVILPADYIIWSKELSVIVKAMGESVLARDNISSVELAVSGQLSVRTKQELQKLKVNIKERYQFAENLG